MLNIILGRKNNCNHDFYFYYKDLVMGDFYEMETEWNFICRNCKKERVLKETPFINYVHKVRKEVSKEKALGIDNSKYDNEVFLFDIYRFEGKLAYMIKEKYGMYKFLKGE